MDNIISKPISKLSLEDLFRQNKRATNIVGANGIMDSPPQNHADDRDLTILPNSNFSPMQP
jgi:hypothetical protein